MCHSELSRGGLARASWPQFVPFPVLNGDFNCISLLRHLLIGSRIKKSNMVFLFNFSFYLNHACLRWLYCLGHCSLHFCMFKKLHITSRIAFLKYEKLLSEIRVFRLIGGIGPFKVWSVESGKLHWSWDLWVSHPFQAWTINLERLTVSYESDFCYLSRHKVSFYRR